MSSKFSLSAAILMYNCVRDGHLTHPNKLATVHCCVFSTLLSSPY